MSQPYVPQEFNKEDEELKCHPSQSGSTATPTLFENTNTAKAFSTAFFEDQLHQEDDLFDEINQQLNQVLINDTYRPSLVSAFQADMSSYLSHEKLTKNSRKMQLEYQNANLKEKEYVFNTYVRADIENISLDKYRHFLLEKILEVGPPSHKNVILDRIFQSINKLIKDLYACKVMQKGLEMMISHPNDSPYQLENYLNFIHSDTPQMKKIYVDKIANQIIQKSLEVLEGNHLYKLLQVVSKYVLQQHNSQVLNNNNEKFELSTDQYGCLIVNKIIDIYPKLFDAQTKTLCNEIITRAIENSSGLTRRQFANYIIQSILEKGQEVHKRLLMDQYLIKDFIPMSMDKYGSNVAEKAIVYGGSQWRTRLWEEVTVSESSFKKLVNDQFANYPIQRLFEYLDQPLRQEYLALLNKFSDNNQLNNHGQIVLKFAQANYNVKRYTQKILQTEKNKQIKNSQKNQNQKSQTKNQNLTNNPQNQQQIDNGFKQMQQEQFQVMMMQQMICYCKNRCHNYIIKIKIIFIMEQ
ncbi:unnamed protein product (macronuclear) [Paramecium tetraurelia]|uniref:PUM-HD domain-containing protein n=1 Tax=Paramecium tetraurelia TaxID=5888 RepID=A0CX13_PARTE|nr:uncharacterized protein GSPATT00001533001 [Paramecium tetraurelia]CAK75330.1 unnamed protein product [Paramecium tetraurelia]|eukprot:XP_001442727.1 hypothetical protein (macronuclear) [Paramecium tetraurelia strain d4-2]